MCEFCKHAYDGMNVNFMNEIFVPLGNTEFEIRTFIGTGRRNPTLSVEFCVACEEIATDELEINYCPVCGKRLPNGTE